MGKNISISENEISKQFTVDKLKTDLVGGGTCLWVPEDAVMLGTKSVAENGTYRASEDGLYGYSEFTVSGVGVVTGRDPETGQEKTVTADPETGELVEEVIPSEIRVIAPPTNPYGTYIDGQTITKDGMVVKAYDANGAELRTVPIGEITLNPTTAVYDASQDRPTRGTATYDGKAVDYAKGVNWEYKSYDPNSRERSFTNKAWSGAYLVGVGTATRNTLYAISLSSGISASGTVTLEREGADPTTAAMPWSNEITSSYDVDGVSKTFYVKQCQSSYYSDTMLSWNGSLNPSEYDLAETAKILFEGDREETPAGSLQTITVSWPRPGDGRVLTATFDILVGPRAGSGED